MAEQAALRMTVVVAVATLGLVAPLAASSAQVSHGSASRTGHQSPPRASRSHALGTGDYIVVLAEPPAASYTGGVPGLAATAAAEGQPFRAAAPTTNRYRSYLADRQDSLAFGLGIQIDQRFTVALNGFSAHVTDKQALALSKSPAVTSISRDRIVAPPTPVRGSTHAAIGPYATTDFLGLTRHGRPVNGWHPSTAGEGVVVAMIDSGYWPENRSFAGSRLRHRSHVSQSNPGPIWHGGGHRTQFLKADGAVFSGRCSAGQRYPAQTCNTKVISARYFDRGFRKQVPRSHWAPTEFASPRDSEGHGSHTSSTVAGNYGVEATFLRRPLGRITGLAPAAKIAVYKAFWAAKDPSQSGAATSDVVAAIDQAVADGVDVINLSAGLGATSDVTNPIDLAFLSAAEAGIFVASAAGNEGERATVQNLAPWETTVGSEQTISLDGTIALGNGRRLLGRAFFIPNAVRARLVQGAGVRRPSATKAASEHCHHATLSRARARGKVVLCLLGSRDFNLIAKVSEAHRVHAAGLIIAYDFPGSGGVAILDRTPIVGATMHEANIVRRYLSRRGPHSVRLSSGNHTGQPGPPLPVASYFSSRGPAAVAGGDILKPDVLAPGESIVGAYSPTQFGAHFSFDDGTSMAAPHAAGLAAYMLSRRPHQPPAEIRSAIMTTTRPVRTQSGHINGDPFAVGAGSLDGRRVLDPGLTFPAAGRDWRGYLAGQGVDEGPGVAPIEPYNLNQASVAVGALVRAVTVERALRNDTGRAETYRASYQGSGHLEVRFSTSAGFRRVASYRFGAHQVRHLDIRVRSRGGSGSWQSGLITFASAHHQVRVPVVAKPLAVFTTPSVDGVGTSGQVVIGGRAASSGTVRSKVSGLAGTDPVPGIVKGDGGTLDKASATKLTVPDGAVVTRVDLDGRRGALDLDMYLCVNDGTPFDPNTDECVDSAATASPDEQLISPVPAGKYWIVIDGYLVASAGGHFVLAAWSLPRGDQGNVALTPRHQHVRAGEEFSIVATYGGLDPSQVYLGQVITRRAGSDQAARTWILVHAGTPP